MKRTAPMRRTGFKPKALAPRAERRMDGYTVKGRAPARALATRPAAASTVTRAMPKERPLQHEGYMAVVRRMACMHCNKPGPSQFCHADEGKGERIKSDCRKGWPGCADEPGRLGCHSLIGTARIYPKEQRRAIEADMGKRTRMDVRSRGLWPKSLPAWPADIHEDQHQEEDRDATHCA
jgi:hypothetical protein